VDACSSVAAMAVTLSIKWCLAWALCRYWTAAERLKGVSAAGGLEVVYTDIVAIMQQVGNASADRGIRATASRAEQLNRHIFLHCRFVWLRMTCSHQSRCRRSIDLLLRFR
jgi:hypothetical protein